MIYVFILLIVCAFISSLIALYYAISSIYYSRKAERLLASLKRF